MLMNSCATTPEPAKATTAQASPAAAQSSANAEQEIMQLERDWAESYKKNDLAFQERLVADDYIFSDSHLKTQNKQQGIEEFKARTNTDESYEFQDMRVKIYGDTAVATGHQITKGKKKDGTPFKNNGRFTDIFVKRNGNWQTVAGHNSAIEEPKK